MYQLFPVLKDVIISSEHVFTSFLQSDSPGTQPLGFVIHCCDGRDALPSPPSDRVCVCVCVGGNRCRKCFTRSLCGSETAFGSWGTWSWGRFRGSRTDRFLLMLSTVLRQKSLTRASHFYVLDCLIGLFVSRNLYHSIKNRKMRSVQCVKGWRSPPHRVLIQPSRSRTNMNERLWQKSALSVFYN